NTSVMGGLMRRQTLAIRVTLFRARKHLTLDEMVSMSVGYPVQLMAIYRDTGEHSFGTSCPAVLGGDVERKCYNTISTCPVPSSFNLGAHVDVFYDPANMQGVCTPNLRLWLINAGIDVLRDCFFYVFMCVLSYTLY